MLTLAQLSTELRDGDPSTFELANEDILEPAAAYLFELGQLFRCNLPILQS